MKIRVGALRKLISETLDQMKLGVAGRGFNPGADDDDDEPRKLNLKRGERVNLEPDEGNWAKIWSKDAPNAGEWNDETDDDLEKWVMDDDSPASGDVTTHTSPKGLKKVN